MSGEHGSPGSLSAAGRHRRPLLVALSLTALFMVVEAIVAVLSGSLALLSDAGHMLTDVAGLALALLAIQYGRRRSNPSHTYGLYRLEVLAALANTVLLFAVAGYVLYEAYGRLRDPPDVPGAPLLIVASIGLLVNVASFLALRRGAKESLNIRGAFLEVLSDLLGSLGVIVAGVILLTTGWPYADPIVGAAIGLFILPRAWRLGGEALRILLEIAPREVDVGSLEARLRGIPGVGGVHDLHVWTLTSGLRAASGHLRLVEGAESGPVLEAATTALNREFEIEHVTLQVEPSDHREPRVEV